MSAEIVLGGFFVLIILAFFAGMILFPKIFGISETDRTDAPKQDDRTEE